MLSKFLDPSVMDRLTQYVLPAMSEVMIDLHHCRTAKDVIRKRTCYVSGLPRTDDSNKIDEISELLLALFEPYSPVDIHMLTGRGQAYITVCNYSRLLLFLLC